MPITREWHGYLIGDIDAAGAMLRKPIAGVTFRRYTTRTYTSAKGRPAPSAVTVDIDTGRKLYPLRKIEGATQDPPVPVPYTVQEWDAQRPGIGWWGGTGGWEHGR